MIVQKSGRHHGKSPIPALRGLRQSGGRYSLRHLLTRRAGEGHGGGENMYAAVHENGMHKYSHR